MTAQGTGPLIRALRQQRGLTQKQLAETLMVSDKAVSKWERGAGLPDISLLPELSAVLGVETDRLLAGSPPDVSAGGNMKNVKFYLCPDCGNLISATKPVSASCCGRPLIERVAEKANERHRLKVESVEDEWFITSDHEMTKEHHICFVAFATGERLQTIVTYPEWELQLRLPRSGHGRLFFGCTEHGLFWQTL